ncbi:MAG TPA: peptidylprolyl isomerase [Actinomycetota bacterium]|nr:peptidylprolyl isomerase [Actinomycetota bacterium]
MSDRSTQLRRRRAIRWVVALTVVAVVVVTGYVSARPPVEPPHPRPEHPADKVACGGTEPPAPSPGSYPSPAAVLDAGVDYGAVIHTSCGDVTVDLLEDDAPANVNNFVFLAREHFYDGLQFFRIEANSVIEAGDPNDVVFDPPDGPGYTIPDELPKEPNDYTLGAVGMANEGRPNTGGSAFFIVVHENRPAGYQTAYSLFGRVDESSFETLKEISLVPTHGGDQPLEAVRPVTPVYIESIEITEN